MKTLRFVTLLSLMGLLLFSLLPRAGRAEDLRDLPLDHWANPVLDRYQAKGYFTFPVARPWSRDEVARALAPLLTSYLAGKKSFTRAETYDLIRLFQEFLPGSQGVGSKRLVRQDLLTLGSKKAFVGGDMALGGLVEASKGNKPYTQGRASADLWGSTGKGFVFDEGFTGILEQEERRNVQVSQTQLTWRGGKFLTDWAYLRFKLPWLSLSLGRSAKWWGPGRFGTLLLSDNAPTFDAVDLRYTNRYLDFRSTAGVLSTDSGRYFSGHRLGVTLPKHIDLGASEVVVYQARHPLPAYLNPLLPFYAVSWNERDDDNILWALDASWRPGWGTAWYGELLMDDVIYEQKSTPAPQKLGFLGGLRWADPLRLKDTDFKAEYAGVLKWVYTHRRRENRYVGTDTSKVLGHWLGPDGEALDLRLEHRVHPRLNLGLGFSQTRHGEGQVGIARDEIMDDPHTKFLSGTVERQDVGKMFVEWQPWFWLALKADGGVGKVRNAGNVAGENREVSTMTTTLKVDW